jgi:hypothetical protein
MDRLCYVGQPVAKQYYLPFLEPACGKQGVTPKKYLPVFVISVAKTGITVIIRGSLSL